MEIETIRYGTRTFLQFGVTYCLIRTVCADKILKAQYLIETIKSTDKNCRTANEWENVLMSVLLFLFVTEKFSLLRN
jgi:hypothetical protein